VITGTLCLFKVDFLYNKHPFIYYKGNLLLERFEFDF